MRKNNVGDSKPGTSFKMPGPVRESDCVPGHSDGRPSYVKKSTPMLDTYKSRQHAGKSPPFSPHQEPGKAVGHSDGHPSYTKKSKPSFDTTRGGLQPPPTGMGGHKVS
jgi:hypothetical protein